MDQRMGRRDLLRLGGSAALAAALGTVSACQGGKRAPPPPPRPGPATPTSRPGQTFEPDAGPPLWRRAAARGLIFGAATGAPRLKDRAYAAALAEEAAMVVPEAELKWPLLRPQLDRFQFGGADRVAAFAAEQRLLLRGHTLVWGDRFFAPGVLEQLEAAPDPERLLVAHVRAVAARYAGRMYAWDVVNEALGRSRAPTAARPLEPNWVWYRRLGPGFVDTAFRAAAEADSVAMLAFNETGFELGRSDPLAPARREAALVLLAGLLDRGVPVHAFGIEAHLDAAAFPSGFDPDGYRAFLADAAGLGLTLMVSELDVNDARLEGDGQRRDQVVAGVYADYLAVALDEPAVAAVGTWGLTDRYSWLQVKARRPDGRPLRPLLLDASLRRKPAWAAAAAAFDQAPKRPLRTPIRFPRQAGSP
jgi:endo-1,4-beta-xylanase